MPATATLIAHHTRAEHVVAVPLPPAPYALVVDDGSGALRRHGGGDAPPRVRRRGALQLALFGHDAPAPVAPVDLPAPPTGIRRGNPRDQGVIGVGDAIGWFAAHGYVVSIPLVDNQRYDLVVDDGVDLLRVQVKTTTRRGRGGVFVAMIETAGGNQSFHTRRSFDRNASDLLYMLTDDGDRFLIPTGAVSSRTSLTLGRKYARYRVC